MKKNIYTYVYMKNKQNKNAEFHKYFKIKANCELLVVQISHILYYFMQSKYHLK